MNQGRNKQHIREPNDEEKQIIVSVRHCARELDDILQGARRKSQLDARQFAQTTAPSLFRGVDSYADLYEKLKIKSRQALDRLFQRARDVDDMVDAQDAIDETEECWRNFLNNIDSDIKKSLNTVQPIKVPGDYLDLAKPRLIDCKNLTECSVLEKLSGFTSFLLVFQPAYLPDVPARCRASDISKVIADFRRLNVGFAVITWGPEELVRNWMKHLSKHIQWPILWDRDNFFPNHLSFNRGCAHLWAPEMLDFCGCQRVVYKRSFDRPPLDFDWGEWNWVGGEVLVASPTASRLMYKKNLDAHVKEVAFGKDGDSNNPFPLRMPDSESSARICLLHRAKTIADMAVPGNIYQSALSCFAAAQGKTEAAVIEDIRVNRRLATPPESGRLQYEAQTGMYYDPETELHYDSKTGYFYDAVKSTYYYWSSADQRYVPANEVVRAQLVAKEEANLAAIRAAAERSVKQQEAARVAGARVAAQLAAIHAEKDEYASYAYATCFLSQEEERQQIRRDDDNCAASRSIHAASITGIEDTLKLMSPGYRRPNPPSTSSGGGEALYPPGCPPPPGT